MKQGPHWDSFEALRIRPAENLRAIAPRSYATLRARDNDLVILRRQDFDALLRAAELKELRESVELLEAAVKVLPEGNERSLMAATLKLVQGSLSRNTFHAADAGVES